MRAPRARHRALAIARRRWTWRRRRMRRAARGALIRVRARAPRTSRTRCARCALRDARRAWSPGLLYTGSWDHTAKKWGIHTGACLLTFAGHKQDVIGLHLCTSSARLFTCADRVRCWDVHDGSCVCVFGASTFYCAIADGGSLYAAQYDGQILHFALQRPTPPGAARASRATIGASHALAGGGGELGVVAAGAATGFAAGAGVGVTSGNAADGGGGGSTGGVAGALEVRAAVRVLSGHESGVMGFDLRDDLLVSASIDSTAKTWSRSSGEVLRTFVGHTAQLRAVQLWRDTLITGSYDQTIRQWDLETGAQLRLFHGHTDAIRAIVVGVDFMSCFMWSASSDGTVRQWDLESGAQMHRLSAHEESIFALAHADGVLYTGSADCTAKRFDLHTGRCIMTFPRKAEQRAADGDATALHLPALHLPPAPGGAPPQPPPARET